MTRMNLNTASSTTTIAVAADYADAMMTARKAKNVLFLLLLLVLLTQLALFFLLKFNVVRLGDEVAVEATPSTSTSTSSSGAAATQASDAATQPAGDSASASTTVTTAGRKSGRVEDILRYVIPVTDFLGIVLAVILGVVLLLIVTIMLVGRLIGVSHVTSAFVWCVVLTVLLFPWQSFLIGGPWNGRTSPPGGSSAYAADAGLRPPDPTFKIPGVLYTWEELGYDVRHFADYDTKRVVLKWARYAGFPIAALLLLLMVQAKSSRGLKFALGESEVQVEVTSPHV